jgi:hypothetical protein
MSGSTYTALVNRIKTRFFTAKKKKPQPDPKKMVGKTFQVFLPKENRIYVCVHCLAHLACHDDLISKSFQGSQGRAYLFNQVVNVGTGPAEERYLLTGLHAVADIYCESCKNTLGWKYEQAFESSQKYKEGKYIIELIHLIKDNGWDTQYSSFSTSGAHAKSTLGISGGGGGGANCKAFDFLKRSGMFGKSLKCSAATVATSASTAITATAAATTAAAANTNSTSGFNASSTSTKSTN